MRKNDGGLVMPDAKIHLKGGCSSFVYWDKDSSIKCVGCRKTFRQSELARHMDCCLDHWLHLADKTNPQRPESNENDYRSTEISKTREAAKAQVDQDPSLLPLKDVCRSNDDKKAMDEKLNTEQNCAKLEQEAPGDLLDLRLKKNGPLL